MGKPRLLKALELTVLLSLPSAGILGTYHTMPAWPLLSLCLEGAGPFLQNSDWNMTVFSLLIQHGHNAI